MVCYHILKIVGFIECTVLKGKDKMHSQTVQQTTKPSQSSFSIGTNG